MKKKFKNLFLFVFLVFFIVTTIHSKPRFSFKLIGGFSSMGGGDLNEAIKERRKLSSDYNNLGINAEFDLDEFRWLTTLKGELMVHLTPNFGIGIGTEYLSKTNKGTGHVDHNDGILYWLGTESSELNYNSDISILMKAVPVIFNLYYFVPVGEKTSVFFSIGAAYYFGSFEYITDYDLSLKETTLDEIYRYTENGKPENKAKATSLGFQGGVGLEFDFTSNISLVAEINARMVNFKNWEGDVTNEHWSWASSHWIETVGYAGYVDFDSDSGRYSETGKMWHYTTPDFITEGDYKTVGIFKDRPLSADREAEINLNGLQFRIGIRIRI